ncbi:TrmH family RNA methyltransferase [Roseivirga thermotolerans]|uniref:RNA methyltransferase n=1 Tax=Roseivirga thermotolerans TaxID=1758176 RepID=A0ABQ3IBW0_9BACT|nr:RNA methyltransferase [Roseivirga thermotolerans]GHE69023.1 RNA methyltransferase [Roseivirga thermotolerans]
MLSKRQSKYFKSLQLKKYRQAEGKFLVEGAKGVEEVLKSDWEVEALLATSEYLKTLDKGLFRKKFDLFEVKENDLLQVGTFKSNSTGLAVVKMPEQSLNANWEEEMVLALDQVNDPGNLGTIVRIADWYGIKQIVCSRDTTDVFSPKVINATMGSFTRVKVHYTDLRSFLSECERHVYGALLDGQSIYQTKLQHGVILMGSESHGISEELRPLVTHSIKIPGRGGAESLNVAVATAVVLDNFARNI